MHARPLRLPLIGLTRAQPPFAEKDGYEQRGDPKELAEASAIDGRPDDGDKEQEAQNRGGGRHEHRATSQADGGLGSGGANASFLPRIRRSAHAIGS